MGSHCGLLSREGSFRCETVQPAASESDANGIFGHSWTDDGKQPFWASVSHRRRDHGRDFHGVFCEGGIFGYLAIEKKNIAVFAVREVLEAFGNVAPGHAELCENDLIPARIDVDLKPERSILQFRDDRIKRSPASS